MKIQHAIAVVAVLVAIVGIVLGTASLSVDSPDLASTPTVHCGSAFGGVDDRTWLADYQANVGAAMAGQSDPQTSYTERCTAAVSARRTVVWPLLGVAAAALLLAGLTSIPRRPQRADDGQTVATAG